MQLIGKLTTCSIWVLSDFIDTHFRATQFNGTAHVHAPVKVLHVLTLICLKIMLPEKKTNVKLFRWKVVLLEYAAKLIRDVIIQFYAETTFKRI